MSASKLILSFAHPKHGAVGFTYILDILSVPAWGGWSLRKLRQAYNGPCLRLADNSSDTTAPTVILDVGFVNNYFDQASALAFAHQLALLTKQCYVTILYDQTGNGRDLKLTNDPTVAFFPVFTDNTGAPLINFNGKPVPKFVGNEIAGTGGQTGSAFWHNTTADHITVDGQWTSNSVFVYEFQSQQETAFFNAGYALNTLLGGSRLLANIPKAFTFDTGVTFYQTAAAGAALINGSQKAITTVRDLSGITDYQNNTTSGKTLTASVNLNQAEFYYGRNAAAFGSFGFGETVLFGSALTDADRLTLVNNQISYWNLTP
jgi:hypothetical protein